MPYLAIQCFNEIVNMLQLNNLRAFQVIIGYAQNIWSNYEWAKFHRQNLLVSLKIQMWKKSEEIDEFNENLMIGVR